MKICIPTLLRGNEQSHAGAWERAKEFKSDFGGDCLPCSDFEANGLYLLICGLSYNLFSLMRQLLPGSLASHRVTSIRYKLYAIAGKIVKTARRLYIKIRDKHQQMLQEVLLCLKRFEPPPI